MERARRWLKPMSVAASLSDDPAFAAANTLRKIRVHGGIAATLSVRAGGATGIETLSENGGYRLKFPRTHARHAEAVIINTGGGVVGGDRISLDFSIGHGADAIVTTQAAERIYRSTGPDAEIHTTLRVANGARLIWAPQETILFSGARLRRTYEMDLPSSASLLFGESMVFGRVASGEIMAGGAINDRWHVRRDGRLVFAEASRLDELLEGALRRPALLGGARAVACILYVAGDAEARLTSVRAALEGVDATAGVSAWNGMLIVRILADAARSMRHAMVRAMRELSGATMPRVWSI